MPASVGRGPNPAVPTPAAAAGGPFSPDSSTATPVTPAFEKGGQLFLDKNRGT
ncbi:unnamed protein product [Ectocarpus sp. 6 AP-2014]